MNQVIGKRNLYDSGMVIRILFYMVLLPLGFCHAQQAVPYPYSTNSQVNFIRTWEAQRPFITDAELSSVSNTILDVKQSTTYFDGLGRPIQMVAKGVSPNGFDMVTPIVYDVFGKESTTYLPFIASGTDGNTSLNDGLLKINPFQQQAYFYSDNNSGSPIKGQGETFYYSKTDFEASPLNRIQKTYAPGNSWVGNGVGINQQYLVNALADSVVIWHMNIADDNAPVKDGIVYYPEGSLYKNITKDERDNKTIEYKDKEGKVILKKVQYWGSSVLPVGHSGWYCTYYIYDDLNNLRYVLPPKATEWLYSHNWTFDGINYSGSSIAKELCFSYNYDARKRMIIKRVPGAGEIGMVYDIRDRLVFTQDANLRTSNQWLSTQFDEHNRPRITGLITYSGTLSQLQQLVTTQTTGAGTSTVTVAGSSSSSFPTDLTLKNEQQAGTFQATQSITLTNEFSTKENGEFTAEIVAGNGGSNSSNLIMINKTPIPPGVTVDPLTITFYDDYSWVAGTNSSLSSSLDGSNISNSNYFFTTYNASPNFAVPISQFTSAKGMITGGMTKVLGSNNQYLYQVSYYDDHGRVIQTQGLNVTGGKDIVTNQYDFTGKVLRSLSLQQKSGSNGQNHSILNKMNYDAVGRLLTNFRTISSFINGQTYTMPEQSIFNNQYSEMRQLQNKGLGNNIESLAFDYNIRGWMTTINRNYLAGGTGNFFGMELSYDKTSSKAGTTYAATQLNGNIAGTVWRSAGDGVCRKYDFTYDAANRLTGADFNQQYGAVWQKSDPASSSFKMDFSVSNLGYDANGNILSMTQQGFRLGSSAPIDQLIYSYDKSGFSNKLTQVSDASNDPNSKLGDFHYSGGKQSTDYSYDANGNLNQDNNKSISSIRYNHLNLPKQINITGKGTISYTYDAGGNKLLKTIVDNTLTPAVTTTTTYLGEMVYQDDILQMIGHGEGRVRWAFHRYLNGTTANGFEYDYFLKDHLGNTRVVLTQEKDTAQYVATMESAYQGTENALFYNIPQTVFPVTSIPGTYPSDNTTDPNSFVAKVDGNLKKVGPAIILKVMAGDKFDLAVKSFYRSGGAVSSPNSYLSDLLSTLATGLVSATGGSKGTFADLNNGTTGPLAGALNSFASTKDITPSDRPKAYLNWIIMDEQFRSVNSKAYVIQTPNSLVPLGEKEINVTKSGYLYIWVSNETPGWDVFFDNLSIRTYSGPLLEETHYYPFGLTMAGISDKALKTQYAENKYKFNDGTELQNKEFSDGSGLELYKTDFRPYDPQIGRFTQIDELSQLDFDNSPYTYANNNPILSNDPTGLTTVSDTTHPQVLQDAIVTPQKDLDAKNGQVYEPRNPVLNFLLGDRIFVGHSHVGKTWWEVRYSVDSKGYLTGKVAPNELVYSGPLPGKGINLKSILNLKNFIRGKYVVYRGVKNGLPYYGKALGGVEFRYAKWELEKYSIRVITGLENVSSNAAALGIEQLIIDLNGGIGTGVLSNINNATIKQMYINEGLYWLEQNMPNWETLLKF